MPENTPPIYKGFADVQKISKFFSSNDSRQIIIFKYKNNQGKTMLLFVKCSSDKKCAPIVDYDKDHQETTYKVYDMYKLTEQENDGNTMFVFDVDKKGKETYQIKLTEGANGYTIDHGIKELRNAIQEQENEKQQQSVV